MRFSSVFTLAVIAIICISLVQGEEERKKKQPRCSKKMKKACNPNGKCTVHPNGMEMCACKKGFTGVHCKQRCFHYLVNPMGHRCLNEGQCKQSKRGPSCKCKKGFSGDHCEKCKNGKPAQPCNPQICMFKRCPGSPGAVCKANPCNGCSATFYMPNGDEADCKVKPGTCPTPPPFGICPMLCGTDYDCPKRQKCCSTGCGQTCQDPVNMKKKKGKKARPTTT